jgi:hypothetical protein
MAKRGWSDKLYLGLWEISTPEKAGWGNIFAADTRSAGPYDGDLGCQFHKKMWHPVDVSMAIGGGERVKHN